MNWKLYGGIKGTVTKLISWEVNLKTVEGEHFEAIELGEWQKNNIPMLFSREERLNKDDRDSSQDFYHQ